MPMNIIIFGPNGSGKGTQGAIIKRHFNLPHIESGTIFREHIRRGTELGIEAKSYIDRGQLVPDHITIPMMIERLQNPDCVDGWVLDGFPRSKAQAVSLADSLRSAGIALNYVVEIVLDREVARARIVGRRLCVSDNNHPNHIAFDEIKPVERAGELVCRVCGGELKTRADDQDESAINQRHDIYYDDRVGTIAAVNYFRQIGIAKVVAVDGSKAIGEISQSILAMLGPESSI
ncbi:MAG: adenylate kinase [Polyangiaceae bacterium]|nr:adenylate kinase [Polyangiaceae bacterium]